MALCQPGHVFGSIIAGQHNLVRNSSHEVRKVVVESSHVAVVVLDGAPQHRLLRRRHKGHHRLVADGGVLRLTLGMHLW